MSETADRKFERWRRTGEARALADVFDEIAPQLLRLAIHLVGDVAAAEDLVQSTFVVAIESAQSWDSSRPLDPWLTGILDHRARKLLRARQRPLDDAAREDIERDTPLAHAIASESSAEIAKALDQLEEPYRSVMVLSVMHGMEPAAIAHALTRSPGVVRVQLHRGREMIKKSLPAGVLASMAIAIGPARGMAAVKASVLSHAATTLAQSSVVASGGLFVMKKVLIAAGALVLVASGAVLFARIEAASPRAFEPITTLAPVVRDEVTTPAIAGTATMAPTRQRAAGGPGLLVVSGRLVNLPYPGISTSPSAAVQCKVDVLVLPRNDWRAVVKVSTETAEDGSFQVEIKRPAGVPLTVTVSSPNDPLYRSADEEREVDAARTSVSDFVLERTAYGRLVGLTMDDHGRPLSAVRVRLMPMVRIHTACEAVSDDQGRFEMHPTIETNGDFETDLEGWSLFKATRAQPQKTGGFADVTLTLAPSGKLILQTLDAGGDPRTRSHVRIHVQPAEEDPRFDGEMYRGKRFEVTSDDRGIAEFDQLWIGKPLSIKVRDGSTWWNDVMRDGRLNMYDDPQGDPVVIGPSGVLRLDVPR